MCEEESFLVRTMEGGRITIPQEIRDLMQLEKKGELLRVTLSKATSDIKPMAKYTRYTITFDPATTYLLTAIYREQNEKGIYLTQSNIIRKIVEFVLKNKSLLDKVFKSKTDEILKKALSQEANRTNK